MSMIKVERALDKIELNTAKDVIDEVRGVRTRPA
jgi:hypothetical protein